ncbi:DNA-binding response regulator, OmpR family, contains REC and winged-helix (wHTH) domain [Marininema mesophilum]|uniref:DNA-binding response regulator, OmpR family, contains REC and winged-helix (WHTH) domain n=1 Tax=Marininema mesophilum TaxID=1048340 RepID=A0A1H2W9B4_9BACL|nr:response regulator transcription factor [Marininema mesophilum]SDW76649.1 DNA-binding response regulator, OmpR family, contains REC and winged-helix (wHTH) domain [Marininema mesophilum]
MATRLLLVEDERAILDLLTIVLKKEGYTDLYQAETVAEAERLCQEIHPDLIIMDVMLPDGDGFDLCRHLRQRTSAPILFVTAKDHDLDKLMGLGIGGDDYITKPFNPLEVVARVKAQLRRQKLNSSQLSEESHVIAFGRCHLNEAEGRLVVDGEDVPCPAREFQLLSFLARRPRRIFSRAQLYAEVWGEEILGDENTVMVHIRRLREKIETNPSQPEHLLTVRGLGYKLIPEPNRVKS